MKTDPPSESNINRKAPRRLGDTVDIGGNYQWEAINSSNKVQRFWHQTKQSAIEVLCPPKVGSLILDVGCGSGVITSFLATQYHSNAIGIDGNIKAINFATKQFPNAKFQCRLVDDDYLIEHDVDAIFCLELIEHIYKNQAEALLANFHRLLKSGGSLFITTPNYRSLWPIIEWLMDKLKLAPNLGDDQHVTFYTPDKIRAIVEASGFEITTIRSNCFLAPWAAPFSHRLAKWLDKKELNMTWLLGSILVVVAKKV